MTAATRDYNALSDEDFRREVRGYFEAEYPQELRFLLYRARWREMKDWWRKLDQRGWIAPNWPREWGGMALAAGKMVIYIEELERHGIARAPDQGITQVGPLIMRFGTEAQKSHFLPRTRSGEYIWCQGYSEPNAGSDLASLQTAAVLEGDHFIVNGQKIWTTLADDATHIYLLARTDKTAKKQEGISFFLVDIKTPGITLRPIRNLAGHDEFCQVFFDDVRVPRDALVGKLNDGWTVAKALLGFERLGIGSPRRPQYALNPWKGSRARKGCSRTRASSTASSRSSWTSRTGRRSTAASSSRSSAASRSGRTFPCSRSGPWRPGSAWRSSWWRPAPSRA
jgi:alkylation response protein AidB-like acyl-CoA dehydrogenase